MHQLIEWKNAKYPPVTELFQVRYMYDSTGTMDFFDSPVYVEEIEVTHHNSSVYSNVELEFNKKYGICYAKVIAIKGF